MKGLLGGYGSRATALIFDRCINVYCAKADSDRDFPHVLVYNLPSTVADVEMSKTELLDEVASGLRLLKHAGCQTIYMACNTLYFMRDELMQRVRLTEQELPNMPLRVKNEHPTFFTNTTRVLCSQALINNPIYPGIYNEKQQYLLNMLINGVIRRPPTDHDRNLLSSICAGTWPVILACTELSVIYWSMTKEERDKLNVVDFADTLAKHLAY